MSEDVQRRRSPGKGGSVISAPTPGRDVLAFASVLGSRLGHADDGLATRAILTSAQRVVALVESRGLDGDISLRVREQVDLGEALHRVVSANRMAFTARGVALTTVPAPGVIVTVDELGLDVVISVLCCWAVVRAAPGSEVHATVNAIPGEPRVRLRLDAPAFEDGFIRVASKLADAIGGVLVLDEEIGLAELRLPSPEA